MSSPRTAVHPAGVRRTGTRRPAARRSPARRAKKGGKRTPAAYAARWWPAALLTVAVLAGVAWDTEITAPPTSVDCTLPGSGVTLTAEQVAAASTIAEVGRSRGLPERAVVIALATAQQESRLRNLDYGDRDSLGLFQQRPSQGWGTEAQVQDPVYSAGIFYDRLVQVPGWDTGRLTDVAQTVQRSGFPEAYQQHEAMAVELAAALAREETDALDCR
jgi:hypothetical protein